LLVIPQLAIDRTIVENPRKNRKDVFNELAEVIAEMRQEAKEKGIDKMTKREINAAVVIDTTVLVSAVITPASPNAELFDYIAKQAVAAIPHR